MSPKKRPAVRLLLSVALLALLYAGWQARSSTVPSPQSTDTAVTTPSPPPATPSAPTLPPTAAVSQPLPPSDRPISDVALTLQQRADAGDRKAACRLGIELVRCHRVLAMRALLEASLEEARDPKTIARTPQVTLLATQEHLALAESCSLLPAGLVAHGPAYLRQAALAGEPEAMLRYADGQSLDLGTGMAYLRTPEFDQWRAEAPAILQRALAAGRPEAVDLLLRAHSGDQGLFASLLRDDPEQAHAYFLLQRRLFGSSDALPENLVPPGLDLAARQHAEQLAAQWHEDMFQNRRLDFMTSLHGLSPLYDPYGITRQAYNDHAFCEPVKARTDG